MHRALAREAVKSDHGAAARTLAKEHADRRKHDRERGTAGNDHDQADRAGRHGQSLDEEGAYAIGRAYVEEFEPRRVAVGRDMRVSAPAIMPFTSAW